MIKKPIPSPSGLRIALLALAAAIPASAQTWTGTAGENAGNYGTASNWDTGVPANGSNTNIVFGGDPNPETVLWKSVFLGSARTLRSVTFDSTDPYTLSLYTNAGKDTFTSLTFQGSNPTITVVKGDHVIEGRKVTPTGTTGDLYLNNGTGNGDSSTGRTMTFNIGANASLTLDAKLRTLNSDTRTLQKTGTGRLILTADNAASTGWQHQNSTNGFRIEQGTLVLAGDRSSGNTGNKFSVLAGATMELAAPNSLRTFQSYHTTLTLNGAGFGGVGALYASENATLSEGGGSVVIAGSDAANGAAIGVAAGKTLTVLQDITGDSNLTLTKVGAGILVSASSAVHTFSGSTVVADGTLLFNHESSDIGGSVRVNGPGTFAGRGFIAGNLSVDGAISPGAPNGTILNPASSVVPGSLRVAGAAGCTLAGDSAYNFVLTDWDGIGSGDGWGLLDVDKDIAITATESDRITLTISGWPENFAEEDRSFTFVSSYGGVITGFDEDAFEIDDSGFIGEGTWEIVQVGNNLALEYTAGTTTDPYISWAMLKGLSGEQAAPGEDADGDGLTNFVEFALDGDPLSGANDGKVVGKVAQVSGQSVLTLTLPVHAGADFDGSPAQESDPVKGTVYRIEASENLVNWDVVVSEVTGPDATAIQSSLSLPSLTSGAWEYRTFRVAGTVSGNPKRFIRVVVE